MKWAQQAIIGADGNAVYVDHKPVRDLGRPVTAITCSVQLTDETVAALCRSTNGLRFEPAAAWDANYEQRPDDHTEWGDWPDNRTATVTIIDPDPTAKTFDPEALGLSAEECGLSVECSAELVAADAAT